jgi:hypothetical protein
MLKNCPKCGYERQPRDTAPDYECPKCGIIYSKFRTPAIAGQSLSPETTKTRPFKKPEQESNQLNKFKFYLIGVFILGFISGYFVGREHIKYKLRSVFQQASENIKNGFGGRVEKEKVAARQNPETVNGSQSEETSIAGKYFNILEPVVYRNYHDSDNPTVCTSLEFKATIMNLTTKKRTISTHFYLKDKDGMTLKVDRGYYELDPSSGTKEPRVLGSWYHGKGDYSCNDVTSIELRYSLFNDAKEISLELPIRDLK